jgi:hypothetical protein
MEKLDGLFAAKISLGYDYEDEMGLWRRQQGWKRSMHDGPGRT